MNGSWQHRDLLVVFVKTSGYDFICPVRVLHAAEKVFENERYLVYRQLAY